METKTKIEIEIEKFYSVMQVAKALSVSIYTVRDWIRTGKLQASKMGGRIYRISENDLKKFVEETKRK